MIEADIQDIIRRVKERVAHGDIEGKASSALIAQAAVDADDEDLGDGVFASVGEAVAAARRAFVEYQSIGLDGR